MDAKTEIQAKLTIDNFETWSDHLKAYLISKSLYKYEAGAKSTQDAMYEFAAEDGVTMTKCYNEAVRQRRDYKEK